MTVRASIVIDNYNYARFLRAAIDGALAQTLEGTEVVVVDDGSTDGSQEIIAGYGGRVRSVIKENGGQTSAFNAGLSVASGSVVCFLDSDDLLAPRAMEAAVDAIHTRRAVKAHWPLRTIEADGTPIDELLPRGQLADGDLRDEVLAHGPESYPTPPTSGNAWSREFLDEVMPLPEIEVRHEVGSASADAYLSDVAPLFGPVARIDDELGCYRLHGDNDYSSLGFEECPTRVRCRPGGLADRVVATSIRGRARGAARGTAPRCRPGARRRPGGWGGGRAWAAHTPLPRTRR
ncbi:MAG: glycosyltransferase [Actinobacteria bacterium]|nr:MAG: glycosyltransferase [Actinomycetota bacterium]